MKEKKTCTLDEVDKNLGVDCLDIAKDVNWALKIIVYLVFSLYFTEY